MAAIRKNWQKASLVTILFLLVLVKLVANDVYSEINKSFPILKDIYTQVLIKYVDDVDSETLMKAGVEGLMSELDPYSSYVEREDKEQLEILTDGKYEGVGMALSQRGGYVTVIEPPFLDTPASRAGIREGDKILSVDGESIKGLSLDETVAKIRGPAGSPVVLTIHRQGIEEDVDYTLIREKIQIQDVRYAGIIEDRIGYIQLTRFSKNAALEVRDAILSFKDQGIRGLILDLRFNPGGLLESAVQVSDLFVPKGEEIVSIRGRTTSSNREFKAVWEPIYANAPLIVLVNRGSASASEIVAGAIQDNDLGIVIGDTTFGKGLVQTVYPLSKNAALKLTTSKYYTPSGRCIQRHDYSKNEGKDDVVDDKSYFTMNGRPVTGGGGIIPDILVEPEPVSDIVWDLRRKSHYFNFALEYASVHVGLDSTVQINDDVITSFKNYLDDSDYKFEHPAEKALEELKQEVREKGYDLKVIAAADALGASINQMKDDIFEEGLGDIKRILRLELASKLYGVRRETEIALEDDKVIQKAKNMIDDSMFYASLLDQ